MCSRSAAGVQRMRIYERNICSSREAISASSMNSPRSACSTPSRTAARKRASSSSRRNAASFTRRSGSVPELAAICESRASCSGVKWTSIAFRLRETLPRGNLASPARAPSSPCYPVCKKLNPIGRNHESCQCAPRNHGTRDCAFGPAVYSAEDQSKSR